MAIRLDKFLKLARLVKRRTVAQEMVEAGAVRIDGRKVKPSSDVKVGSTLEVAFPRRLLVVEVLVDEETVLKRRGCEPYSLIEDKRVDPETKLWDR
ncbi:MULTISPECIES: RNA-binding S4 domain-containing protein [Dethiosulfovibrio]|uniref:RQC P-site tRNA stabilizing factor n=2 Tax=Dethiosulfovibrio TaxID=47054 RepID=A0ABS9EJR3_9BACT|nr:MULTISPECIES: RNA-binding S4 domain-containing protein [Dethiosulfovibrio]MCF4112969.1 RNA-binding S4 domain-containing protein [Dethiosulfovibrio russensis]MCF4141433.1 RNA-binding S4 domain-containing protein [Dethiosulfovibrio marinus]MCF4144389.1 RNA-binding S4 domain-containing protein [Dethiosulfovibrio acidaminovorans]